MVESVSLEFNTFKIIGPEESTEGSGMEAPEQSRKLVVEGGDSIVDFDNNDVPDAEVLLLRSVYEPMDGTVDERAAAITGGVLDGRWLLVAQHLACWRLLWAPERAQDLPSLGMLLTQLLEAESLLATYA